LPTSLHGLEALQILDLSFNKLTSLAPAETLSSLSALLELKLVRNRIRELREGAFDRLPRLALIDLESNDLVLVERNAIRGLPELQALRLGKNRIQVLRRPRVHVFWLLSLRQRSKSFKATINLA
jgi:Leucine-rich repeat (LRR) protein